MLSLSINWKCVKNTNIPNLCLFQMFRSYFYLSLRWSISINLLNVLLIILMVFHTKKKHFKFTCVVDPINELLVKAWTLCISHGFGKWNWMDGKLSCWFSWQMLLKYIYKVYIYVLLLLTIMHQFIYWV